MATNLSSHKFMSRILKAALGLVAGLALLHQAAAFSLWGPAEPWQTAALDYGTRFWYSFVVLTNGTEYVDAELGGTKNIGEGSRMNCGVVTYAYDATFLTYFGADGVKAVDAAMAVLNGLPKVSGSTPNLAEYLTQGNQRVNYSAQALGLLDLKSFTMTILLEHMGLSGETHVFDLRERIPVAGSTCDNYYFVILRNFDPVTYSPTTYVNGANYTYQIYNSCPPSADVGDAIESYVDPEVLPYASTAVATYQSLQKGGFYLGLTRDDFGGLRYLYRKNNFNNENLDPTCVAGQSGSPWTIVVTTNTTTTTAGGTATTVTATNFQGLLGGVEKINFVKVKYNSTLGTAFLTNTAHFTIPVLTNGQVSSLPVTRTIPAPDIIFTAADLALPSVPPSDIPFARTVTFVTTTVPVSPGGGVLPSVIAPQFVVTFSKVGPIYFNEDFYFLSQNQILAYPNFIWGSFDGSTNAPIVFPIGSSITTLEDEAASGGGIPFSTWDPVSTNGPVSAPIIITQ
jgi:hypothetical protein